MGMKQIHGKLTPGKVDETMDKLREQNDLSEEIVQAITGNQLGEPVDDMELEDELEAMQQEHLDEQMLKTGNVPRNRQWRTTKRQSWRSCAPKWPCRPLDMHVTKRSGLQLGPLTAYRCLELRGCDMHSCFHPQPSFFDTLSVVFCGVGVFRCVSLASRNPLPDRSDVAWSCSCCL